LYIDGQLVWESEVKEDQVRPEWNVVLPRNVAIRSNSLFRLELWDRDTSISADPIGSIERRGLPENAVPDAQARLSLDSKATVLIMVGAPRPHKGVGLSVEARPDALKVIGLEPFSPASRAGIRVGDMIVGVGNERVSHMGPNDAVSELSMAAERGHKLTVAGASGTNEREITLDQGYVWLIM
jgi:S1-C subfamily serine protease